MAQIAKLSKADIVEFYNHYIHPDSPTRAKISVHMHAQSSSGEKPTMLALLERFLTSTGATIDQPKLQQRFEGMDTGKSESKEILSTLEQYLIVDLKMDAEEAKSIVEQGASLMSTMSAKSSDATEPSSSSAVTEDKVKDEENDASKVKQGSRSIVIDDVLAFKASLSATAGPRPVKPLSDFEELSSKL